jgi:hypothetical protein
MALPLSKLAPISILGELGIEVNSVLPFIFACPLCGGKATAYRDASFDHWICCKKCGYSGESLELYRRARPHASLNAAMEDLMARGLVEACQMESTLSRYAGMYDKWRELNKLTAESREHLGGTQLEPPMISLLTKYCLYTGWNTSSWPVGLGRYLGGLTRSELGRNPILRKVTLKPCGAALMLPMHDAPGRTSAGYFMTEHEHTIRNLCYAGESLSGKYDDGFMFLDAIIDEDEVVVCLDPLTAIQLHIRNFASSSKPLPVAACSPFTSVSWQLLEGKKVILWSPEITPTLVNHAQRVPHARVFTSDHPQSGPRYVPETPEDRYEYIRHKTVVQVLDQLHDKAVPWASAVNALLLANPVRGKILAASGVLSAGARGQLRSAANTDADRNAIEQLIDLAPATTHANPKGQLIVDKPDGWYRIEKRYRDSHLKEHVTLARISNVKLSFDQITSFPSSGRLRYDGTVVMNGQQARFQIWDIDRYNDQRFVGWLRSFAIERQMGYPVISSPGDFRNFAREISTPLLTTGHDRSGLVDAGVVCKDFIITNGEIPPLRMMESFVDTRGPSRSAIDKSILCGPSVVALAAAAAACTVAMDKTHILLAGHEDTATHVLTRIFEFPAVLQQRRLGVIRRGSNQPLFAYSAQQEETAFVYSKFRSGVAETHALLGKPCINVGVETEFTGAETVFVKFVCWLQRANLTRKDFNICLAEFPKFAATVMPEALIADTMRRFIHLLRPDLRLLNFTVSSRWHQATWVYTKVIGGKLHVIVDAEAINKWRDRSTFRYRLTREALHKLVAGTPHYCRDTMDNIIKFGEGILVDFKELVPDANPGAKIRP